MTPILASDSYCISIARTSKRHKPYDTAGRQTLLECHRAIKFVHTARKHANSTVRPWRRGFPQWLAAIDGVHPAVSSTLFEPWFVLIVVIMCSVYVLCGMWDAYSQGKRSEPWGCRDLCARRWPISPEMAGLSRLKL